MTWTNENIHSQHSVVFGLSLSRVQAYLSGNVFSILSEDAAAQEYLAVQEDQQKLQLVTAQSSLPASQSETQPACRHQLNNTVSVVITIATE